MRRIFLLALLALGIITPAADGMPRLQAIRGDSAAIVTADGRQVLLRGVNVNQLGDYWPQRPGPPGAPPLTENGFPGNPALGINRVRLLLHWSKLEPRRGQFD